MLFTSYEFIGFLIVLFLLYYLVPKKWQWGLLLIASYLFYFMASPVYLIYIAGTTGTVFFLAHRMELIKNKQSEYLKEHKETLDKEEKKQYKSFIKGKQWKLLLLGLFLNLGVLAVAKYTNFCIVNINGVMQIFKVEKQLSFINMILPMGISFYTFQAIGYLIDVYRGTIKAETNIFRFALFVSFFPQLIQGPISRFGDLSKTLFNEHPFSYHNVSFGLQRILWGFFKKLVIADRMLIAVNEITHHADLYEGGFVFLGMLFYALELYADFTGGIDITIGVAQVLGIEVTENFMRPFFSKSIKEYWRRWHITMGTWFTDYIFYPISVCKPMLKLSKHARALLGETLGKRVPVYLSSFVVWFATGIWHGSSWNFIVWGLLNFVVIMVSQELEPLYTKFHHRIHTEDSVLYKCFQIVRTVLIMSCLRTFDCYRDVPLTFKMLGTMFIPQKWSGVWNGTLMNLGLKPLDFMILIAGVFILFMVSMLQRKKMVRERIETLSYTVRYIIWFSLFLIVLLMGIYGIGYDATQFIYNQF